MALLIVLAIIVVASVLLFSHNWLPILAIVHGQFFDHQLSLSLALLGVVFVCTQLAMGAFIWRYRSREQKVLSGKQPSTRSELLWMFLAAALFIGLNTAGTRAWSTNRAIGASQAKDPIHVEVTAEQFRWYFRYPGPDGKFGTLRPELADASLGNPLGLDKSDPAAQDDVVTSVLTLPAGHETELTLRAHDVIHSFFVPELRFKQDAVPGIAIQVHFTAAAPGVYEIACAELCGLGHYKMNAKLKVVPEDIFSAWSASLVKR